MTPAPVLKVGERYALTFPARPDLGTVAVRIAGVDEPLAPTPCGAPRVAVQVIRGYIPEGNSLAGPGDVATMAAFIPVWRKLARDGARRQR